MAQRFCPNHTLIKIVIGTQGGDSFKGFIIPATITDPNLSFAIWQIEIPILPLSVSDVLNFATMLLHR